MNKDHKGYKIVSFTPSYRKRKERCEPSFVLMLLYFRFTYRLSQYIHYRQTFGDQSPHLGSCTTFGSLHKRVLRKIFQKN